MQNNMLRSASVLQDAQGLLPKGGGGFAGAPHPRSVRVNPLRGGRSVDMVLHMLRSEVLPRKWKGVSKATHDAVGVEPAAERAGLSNGLSS